DVASTEEGHEISTRVEDVATVRDALEASFGTAESAKLEWWSTNDIKLDEERAKDVVKLLDLLDDHDDIQNIYANREVE
ncbi:MAG: YebC/PmpR family DNA-binding transcriptional regulator, partial [bacterium]